MRYDAKNTDLLFPKESIEVLINPIQELIEALEKSKEYYENFHLDRIVGEYEELLLFLEKMKQVISAKDPAVTTRNADTPAEIVTVANEKFKELCLSYKSNPEQEKKKIEDSYERGEITLLNIKQILEESKKEN